MPVCDHVPSPRRRPAARALASKNGARSSSRQPAAPGKSSEIAAGRRRTVTGLTLVLAMALAACEGKLSTHGDPVDAIDLARVQPGVSTRADVVAALGTPSNVAVFDENAWYYISNRERTIAFLAPESIERQVVSIYFDDQGVVSSVDKFGLERGREVDVVSRETPSFGQSPTIIQQMLGNLGRFNKETGPGGGGPTGGGR